MAELTTERRQAKLDRKMEKAMNSGYSVAGPTIREALLEDVRAQALVWKASKGEALEEHEKARLIAKAEFFQRFEKFYHRTPTVREIVKEALRHEPVVTEAQAAANRAASRR